MLLYSDEDGPVVTANEAFEKFFLPIKRMRTYGMDGLGAGWMWAHVSWMWVHTPMRIIATAVSHGMTQAQMIPTDSNPKSKSPPPASP